jgi:hypothetical protein
MLYMKKLAGLLTLLLFSTAMAAGQDQPQQTAPAQAPAQTPPASPVHKKARKYVPKYEVSADYTHITFYAPSGPSFGMNGWNGSIDYNFKPRLGLEAEVLGTYNDQVKNGNTTIYTALFGPQIYPLGHRKLTVFGHALFGVGHYQLAFPPLPPFPASTVTRAGAGWELGGGADFYVHKNLGIRVVQLDYDKTDFFSGNASRGNFRISVGVIYRFGQK